MPYYQKPKITQKKIKVSFFLSNIAWLDQFNLTGTIYAQSGGANSADCGCTGCSCSPAGGPAEIDTSPGGGFADTTPY